MELGGNKNAKIYYDENSMVKDGRPDHEAPQHARYKMDLAERADEAIRQEMQARGIQI